VNTLWGATITAEGADQSVTNAGECIDAAGNTARGTTVGPIHVDRTPPTVTVAGAYH